MILLVPVNAYGLPSKSVSVRRKINSFDTIITTSDYGHRKTYTDNRRILLGITSLTNIGPRCKSGPPDIPPECARPSDSSQTYK